nr:endo-1,4-beta-xylanase [Gracilibacillus alcaliphilus]
MKIINILCFLSIVLVGCSNYSDDNVEEAMTAESEETKDEQAEAELQADTIPSLAEAYSQYFPVGAAIEPFQTSDPTVELLKKHVNMLVAENVMKPEIIQPAEGQFNWEPADRIVQFAKENNMEIRFHTLVWHNQVGDWFFLDEAGNQMVNETDEVKREQNKQLLLSRLESHIRAIVERYKDDIKSWDIVNEVVEPEGTDGMRASEWYQITGIDYIETAFLTAREAGGPDIKLYLNDYGTDNPKKRELIYELVKGLLDKQVPIDGIGHQTHIDIHGPSIPSIITSIKRFNELGLDNIITELDMSIYPWGDESDFGTDVPDYLLETQAQRYQELFKAFKEHQDKISAVVFWGIADDHTWLHHFPVNRTNAPLLFDQQHQPKPAFWKVIHTDK